MTTAALNVLAAALPGPGKPLSTRPLPSGVDLTPGPTGQEAGDFRVGDVVAFKANAETCFGPERRYLAPTGALARVVAIEPGGWPCMIGVAWIDRWEHGQSDGCYYAGQFWPATDPNAELVLFELGDLTSEEN